MYIYIYVHIYIYTCINVGSGLYGSKSLGAPTSKLGPGCTLE